MSGALAPLNTRDFRYLLAGFAIGFALSTSLVAARSARSF